MIQKVVAADVIYQPIVVVVHPIFGYLGWIGGEVPTELNRRCIDAIVHDCNNYRLLRSIRLGDASTPKQRQ